MRISKVADEKLAPSWAIEGIDVNAQDFVYNMYISKEAMERVKDLPLDSLSEEQIVSECEQIEKCSSNGALYNYNSKWGNDTISHLKEYAMASGLDMDKFKGLHPEYIEEITVVQASANQIREAQVQAPTREKSALENDPFKLEGLGDDKYMEKTNWEDIKKQEDLTDKPSMMTNAIKPVRGGEDYNANSYSQLPKAQNSITDPNAIETYAETDTEDTGARLKRENEEKVAQRDERHASWEQNKIDDMEHADIIPKGTVFPTESMNAQPGLNSGAAKLANIKAEDIPEKTQGEMIAENNDARKKDIQRKEVSQTWEHIETASVRGVSNSFADALKKALDK